MVVLYTYLSAASSIIVSGQNEVRDYNPPPAKEGYSYPDCYCTDSKGNRVELGQYVCLKIGSQNIWALCDMSVNNPTWRHQSGPCPSV